MSVVARLIDPMAAEPVTAAAEFFQKKSFDLQIRSIVLSIPTNLPQGPLTPGDRLQIHMTPQGVNTVRTTYSYRIKNSATQEGTRDKKYTFELEGGDGRISFTPGDEFRAELRLTKDDKAWQFTWANHRAAAYSFEAIQREPVLHPVGPADRGALADGVTLSVDGKFPTVPALLPDVRRERKK